VIYYNNEIPLKATALVCINQIIVKEKKFKNLNDFAEKEKEK